MTCEVCGKPATKSAVLKDRYYPAICESCHERIAVSGVSSGHAEYVRGRDHEEHVQDIIQPWDGDGKPSNDFRKLYPNQAKQMFGDQGIADAERK